MKYLANLKADNGANHAFDFEADDNELARDHILTVAHDPAMHAHWLVAPEGQIEVSFRRWYAENWHNEGKITPSPKLGK